jgi:cytidine deaminase
VLLLCQLLSLRRVEAARDARKRLYLEGRHEVAAALRTASGEVFAGIHIEADVGFADVRREVSNGINWPRL